MSTRPSDRELLAAVHPALRSGLSPLLRLMSHRVMTRKSVLSRRWIDRLIQRVVGRRIPARLIARSR